MLALPLIKIVLKNCLCYLLGDLDDIKPEFIILNIEVFNAFYVSCCMQQSLSITTTFCLTFVDWGHSLLSIRDVNEILVAIERLQRRIPATSALYDKSCVDVAVHILDTDPLIQSHACFNAHGGTGGSSWVVPYATRRRVSSVSTVRDARAARSGVVDNAVAPLPQTQTQPSKQHTTGEICAATVASHTATSLVDTTHVSELFSQAERLEFAERTAQLLFTTEFLVLIEFTEVIVPLMYGASSSSLQRAALSQSAKEVEKES